MTGHDRPASLPGRFTIMLVRSQGECGDKRFASGVRAKMGVFGQRWQKAAHGFVLGVQLMAVHIVGRPNQLVDAEEGQRERVRISARTTVLRNFASGALEQHAWSIGAGPAKGVNRSGHCVIRNQCLQRPGLLGATDASSKSMVSGSGSDASGAPMNLSQAKPTSPAVRDASRIAIFEEVITPACPV